MLSCSYPDVNVVVGLSGGVDSSVCAYLLKEAGLNVSCLHMVCWRSNDSWCSSDSDMKDAISTASALRLKIDIEDYTEQYKEKVFDYFITAYKNGLTPSPDLVCNKEIKFGLGLNYSLSRNAYFSTGHYAQLIDRLKIHDADLSASLLRSIKSLIYKHPYTQKDQSYFLSTIISNKNLDKVIFPLAYADNKNEVRQIADYIGLKNSKKPDSQGICFVGNVSMTKFLPSYIENSTGNVVKSSGEVIGKHKGLHLYTIGQRHGFDIFVYNSNPLYVVGKNLEQNELIVGIREECYKDILNIKIDECIVEDLDTLQKLSKNDAFAVKIRSSGDFEITNSLKIKDGQMVEITLKRPIFGCAPGQTCVIYYGKAVIACGSLI